MIGYGLKGLYTQYKTDNCPMVQLVNYLFEYPYKEDHLTIAERLLQFNDTDDSLKDELYHLSLIHLLNSLRYSMNKSKLVINEQFLKICAHFNKRTKQLKAAKEAEKQVEEYKYKTYGQKETAQELEDKELAEHFPTFVEYFNDFIRSELNDIKPIEPEPINEEQTNETKNLINQSLLIKTFDLIEMFIDFQHLDFELKDSDFFDKKQLNLFYKSYSLASKLLINNKLTLNSDKALKSHILFSSSINFDYSSFYISENTSSKYIYDFYNDPNQAEAIKCKELLKQFYKRI